MSEQIEENHQDIDGIDGENETEKMEENDGENDPENVEEKMEEKDGNGLKFIKYNSIENYTDQDMVEYIKTSFHDDINIVWIALEKVHGSNFGFTTDGKEIICSKRTSFLNENDKFYDFQGIRDMYRERVFKLFELCAEMHPGLESLTIYGELFGGIYPHPNVQAIDGVSHVQKGIYYCPNIEYYAFDIKLKNLGYMSYDDCERLFQETNFFYAKVLVRGTFDEVYNSNHIFQSTIPQLLGLPPIEHNFAEGIVIKPVFNLYSKKSRIILKKKIDAFSEILKPKRMPKNNNNNQNPDDKNLTEEIKCYCTENRLRNVLSKIGPINNTKKRQE